ncbi:uncharacterized protein N7483_007515 [Penicillium malachiteum]|uniref:uncharacterized protein n=1 Tax=Penicillium malachiteum TaxID=1324776 RepID=UPI002549AA21|nr:uncharacterized protein N7483_007515 [Penicillium malachiteum]KAJ5726158.1 hypothetical protein N7483_007515 [Penicillium malachiteum]
MASSPDGIRLYEDDQEGLLASIVMANDIVNLHCYVQDCGPPLFCEPPEREDDYFFMATVNGSTDTLRVLPEIYQSDPRQKEPLRSRLERRNIRLLNLASVLDALKFIEEAPIQRHVSAVSQETIEDFVCSLLDRGASVRATNEHLSPTQRPTVLGVAAALGSYNLTCRLIADRPDLHGKETWHEIATGSIDNVTALHIASGSWNLAFVQALLEKYGSDELAQAATAPDSRGRLPVHWALLNLDHTFNKPSDEQTISTGTSQGAALNFLANGYVRGAGSLALMKVLLRLNPNIKIVNSQDQSGATALLKVLSYHETRNVVCKSSTMPLVELLLANGADRTAYDKKGQTALHKLATSPSYDDPISPDLLEMFISFVDINREWMDGPSLDGKKSAASRGVSFTSPSGLIRKEKADGTLDYPTLAEKIHALDEIVSVLREAGASMDQLNLARQTPAQLQEQEQKLARWERGGE